jgi:hypothetical protein
MDDRRDHGSGRDHLSALVVDLKARAKAYHLHASQAVDQAWKALHTSNALACQAMAADIEKTLTRIDGIESTVSRAQTRVGRRSPSPPEAPTAQGRHPEDEK